MIDLQALVQKTLDNALFDIDIHSFWQRRMPGGGTENEYVIYTISGGGTEAFADNSPLVKSKNVTVRYYYSIELLGTPKGRERIKDVSLLIEDAMRNAEFYMPNEPFEVGEIEERQSQSDSGFNATVFEFYYYAVV